MAGGDLKSLVEIFNNVLFRIPDFQRGYAWQNKELEDFWEDLISLAGNRFHYTGVLTLEPKKKDEVETLSNWEDDIWLLDGGYKAYHIIDGQQRLTTSIILLKTLLDKFKDTDEILLRPKDDWIKHFLFRSSQSKNYLSYIFGYEKDDPSYEFFKTKILDQISLKASTVTQETLYTKNLWNSKVFFEKKIETLNISDIENIFKKVINQFKYNLYEIGDDLDVYVAFETMNNRGRGLSTLELLKNRLIYLSTLLPQEEYGVEEIKRLRKDIIESWKTVYEFLGQYIETNINLKEKDDDFLKNHWIMYFKYSRDEANVFSKFLLNDYFTVKKVITKQLSLDDIRHYVESISDSIKCWTYIHKPSISPYSPNVKEWLEKLARLGHGAFKPLIMSAMVKNTSEDELKDLLESAEDFVFSIFNISMRQSNTENSSLFKLASKLFKGLKSLDEVIEYIDDATTSWFDFDRFKNDIKDKFERGNGFYDWKGLKYFLFEYELHLLKKAKGDSKIGWEEFNKRIKEETIEHVYPHSANALCWKKRFNKLSKTRRVTLLNSLGNLLLLSQSKNSSLQNSCFKEKKKPESGKPGYFNGSYSEIEVSQSSEWTPQSIFKRGLKLLKFLDERWDLELTEKEKIRLLRLTFLAKK